MNNNCDDRRFVHSLSPLLSQLGWKDAHFIIDESRAGVPPPPDWDLRIACNIMGTGFGLPPGSPTNDSLVDAFVWAKRIPPPPPLPSPEPLLIDDCK